MERKQLGESGSAQKVASTDRQDSELVKLLEGNSALLTGFRVNVGVDIGDEVSVLTTDLNAHMSSHWWKIPFLKFVAGG